MNRFDIAICEEYIAFDVPADRILLHAQFAESFCGNVFARLKESGDTQMVLRRLLNLRKSGRMPRLRLN